MIVAGGVLGAATMEELTAWMAEEGAAPGFMRERDWKAWDAAYLLSLGERAQAEIDEVVDAVAAFVARKSKAELYEAALGRSLLLAPLMDAADLLRDEQLAARGLLRAHARAAPRPRGDPLRPLRAPLRHAPRRTPTRPAPRRGRRGGRSRVVGAACVHRAA